MNFLHRRVVWRSFYWTRRINNMSHCFSDEYYYGLYFNRWSASVGSNMLGQSYLGLDA